MEKRLFKIESNLPVAGNIFRLELSSPGYEFSGEFVDIALDGFALRRPLSVCDASPGRLVLLYKVVGEGTKALSRCPSGKTLDVLCGLGKGFDSSACNKSALLVGGGLGAAPLHLLARKLVSEGKNVTAVLAFNTEADIVLESEMRSLSGSFAIATLDGSRGVKGFATDAIPRADYDYFYTCGPMPMMKAVCGALNIPGEASLEARMGCGSGFCYGCSCKTILGPRRICKDGPVFKKEDIIW